MSMIVSLRSSLYNLETTVIIVVHCDLLRSSLYHPESTESILAHRLGRPEGKANADSFVFRYVFLRCLRIYVIETIADRAGTILSKHAVASLANRTIVTYSALLYSNANSFLSAGS